MNPDQTARPNDSVSQPTIVVGVFDDREDLVRALEELRKAGFREEQTGVAMRGLSADGGRNTEEFEALDWATQSVLTVRVEGRHSDAEDILRRNGAKEITWSNSMTASMAGATDEIVDASS